MTVTSIAPALAVVGFVAYTLYTLAGQGKPGQKAWLLPAVLSAAFAAFSVVTVVQEGLFGFWTEHTDSLWGNQVWFDLLLAIAIGWTLMLPRMRAAGMQPLPWLALTFLTGCVGLLAALARLYWLEAKGRG